MYRLQRGPFGNIVGKAFLLFPQCFLSFNPFLNDGILDMTKLKAFADDKMNVAKMMIYLFNWVENTVGKGENAGYQHFLFFPQCFQKTYTVDT